MKIYKFGIKKVILFVLILSCTSLYAHPGYTYDLKKAGEYEDTNSNDIVDIGDRIKYTFTVINTSSAVNAKITKVILSDPKIMDVNITLLNINLGESKSHIEFYSISQQDINKGKVVNSASAIGYSSCYCELLTTSDNPNTPTPNDPTVTLLTQTPSLTLTKIAKVEGVGTVGDTITYEFNVTNSGNIALSNVDIDDTRIGLVDLMVGDLAVGESKTVTATYIIKAQDVADGNISNVATTTGINDNTGTPVTDTSDNPNTPTPNDPTVTLLGTAKPKAPLSANDDVVNITHYGANDSTVTGNDILGAGMLNEHKWTLLRAPKDGRLKFKSDGTFIYYPTPNIGEGTHSFDYRVTDANGVTDDATVILDIDCTSSQKSDSGDALGSLNLLFMMLLTLWIGLQFIRKEINQ